MPHTRQMDSHSHSLLCEVASKTKYSCQTALGGCSRGQVLQFTPATTGFIGCVHTSLHWKVLGTNSATFLPIISWCHMHMLGYFGCVGWSVLSWYCLLSPTDVQCSCSPCHCSDVLWWRQDVGHVCLWGLYFKCLAGTCRNMVVHPLYDPVCMNYPSTTHCNLQIGAVFDIWWYWVSYAVGLRLFYQSSVLYDLSSECGSLMKQGSWCRVSVQPEWLWGDKLFSLAEYKKHDGFLCEKGPLPW